MGGGQGVSAGENSGEKNGDVTGRQRGGSGRVGTSNVANTTGIEYKHNSIGTEYSVSLSSVRGLDDHRPTMSMPLGHVGRSRRIRRINDKAMLTNKNS